MADLFSSAASWLADKLIGAAGVSVTYKRSSTTLTLSGVKAEVDFDVVEADTGLPVDWEGVTWLFKSSDLAFRPRTGDRIVETSGIEWEVSAPDDREPWKWADPQRMLLMVYAKHVKG